MKSLISEQERELLTSSGYELGVYEGEARGEARGEKRGIKIGRADGRKDATIAHARGFRDFGVSPEIIAKVTGLSPEAIAAL